MKVMIFSVLLLLIYGCSSQDSNAQENIENEIDDEDYSGRTIKRVEMEIDEQNRVYVNGRLLKGIYASYDSKTENFEFWIEVPGFKKGDVLFRAKIDSNGFQINLDVEDSLTAKNPALQDRKLIQMGSRKVVDSTDYYIALERNHDDPDNRYEVFWKNSVMILSEREMYSFSKMFDNNSPDSSYIQRLVKTSKIKSKLYSRMK